MKFKIDKWDILALGGPWLLVIIAIIAGIIIIIASVGIMGQEDSSSSDTPTPTGGGELSFDSSVTAEKVNTYLTQKSSPAAGKSTTEAIIEHCKKYNVNPGFIMGIFQAEKSCVDEPDHATYGCNNPGNIKLGSASGFDFQFSTCSHNSKFASYASWGDGFGAMAQKLRTEYIDKGLVTVARVNLRYAHENPLSIEEINRMSDAEVEKKVQEMGGQDWVNTVKKVMEEFKQN